MLGILGLALTGAAVVIGYVNSRHFVRTRLRYVDAAQRRTTPYISGLVGGAGRGTGRVVVAGGGHWSGVAVWCGGWDGSRARRARHSQGDGGVTGAVVESMRGRGAA